MSAEELERLARDQWPRLLALARRHARTRADAEDAVQEAFAIAFAVRARIRPQTAVGYLAVIARHEASRLGRRTDGVWSLDRTLPGTDGLSALDLVADHRHPDRDAVIDALTACGRPNPTTRAP
jgi:DNA-directed RNA polymerase specialized sigma24 family protein